MLLNLFRLDRDVGRYAPLHAPESDCVFLEPGSKLSGGSEPHSNGLPPSHFLDIDYSSCGIEEYYFPWIIDPVDSDLYHTGQTFEDAAGKVTHSMTEFRSKLANVHKYQFRGRRREKDGIELYGRSPDGLAGEHTVKRVSVRSDTLIISPQVSVPGVGERCRIH